MSDFQNTGKNVRLGRILNKTTGRAAVVAFDHGVHLGMIPGIEKPGELLESLAEAGADAFLVGPGTARRFASVFTGRGAPAMIARVDWTNRWRDGQSLGSDEGRGRLISSVEGAAKLGADAVLVYMFIGYENPDDEAANIANVTRVAEDCEKAGIGCIIEPMPRGLRVGEKQYDAGFVSLGARMACELGADVLKTDYTGDADSFRKVVAASFRPVLIAGGPKANSDRESLAMVRGALDAGAQGMFIGRNVFQSQSPARMMRAYVSMIHDNVGIDSALASL